MPIRIDRTGLSGFFRYSLMNKMQMKNHFPSALFIALLPY